MISQIVAPPPPPPPPSLRQPQMFGMRLVSSRGPMQQQPISIINSNHPAYHKYHQPFLVQHQQPQINLMNTNSPNTSSSLSSDFLSIKSASTSVSSSSPNLIKSFSNPSPTARNAIRMSPSMRLQTMTGRHVTNASKASTVTNSTTDAQAPLSTKQKPEPIYSLVNQAPVRKNTAYEARLKLITQNRLGSSV
jgi:hypothetical protein